MQGRLIGKQYPDTSTVTYTYETTTSRLKSIKDALNQVKAFSYAKDNLPLAITYTAAVNPTPNVSFAYDGYFPRLASMTDGTGTTKYAYVPIGSLGALQLQQEQSPLASSAITSAYDELGQANRELIPTTPPPPSRWRCCCRWRCCKSATPFNTATFAVVAVLLSDGGSSLGCCRVSWAAS